MNADESSNVETLFARQREGLGIPPVSVVVPLFNYGHFLVETLDSVVQQTLPELDLVIVDDASTDDSASVAKQWLEIHAQRFRKATLLRHRLNAGLAHSRNDGIRHTESEFVFPFDADNVIYPTCLAKLERSLRNSQASFAYCLVERFCVPASGLQPPHLIHLHAWDPETLAVVNRIDAMVLLRRSAWDLLEGYSTTMPRPGWEDYDFWFRMARANGYGLQVHQILARYRVHPSSMLHTVTNRKDSQVELNRYLRDQYPEFFIGL